MIQLPFMRFLVPALTTMLIVATGAYANEQQASSRALDRQMPTLAIQGVGEVTAKPDIATFTFSVEAEAKTQDEAQSLSAEKINAITAFLKENNVDEKDIKTSNYSVYPKYEQESIDYIGGTVTSFYPPQKTVQVGFIASQQITVKVRAIDTAGALLSGVGENGATNIGSISLSVDDIEKVKSEALALAIADAQAKAEERAEQLGVRLGDIVGYYENNDYGYGRDYRSMSAAYASEEKALTTPEISTGENTYKADVTINYTFR